MRVFVYEYVCVCLYIVCKLVCTNGYVCVYACAHILGLVVACVLRQMQCEGAAADWLSMTHHRVSEVSAVLHSMYSNKNSHTLHTWR